MSVIHALKGGTVAARGRLRKGLSVAQLALSVVVLLIAALFGQTLRKLRLVDSGFERDRVLIASVAPGGYSPERPNLLIDLPDQAGRFTSTQASARQLQLGLRFVF